MVQEREKVMKANFDNMRIWLYMVEWTLTK